MLKEYKKTKYKQSADIGEYIYDKNFLVSYEDVKKIYLEDNGEITVEEFSNILYNSYKYAISLLSYKEIPERNDVVINKEKLYNDVYNYLKDKNKYALDIIADSIDQTLYELYLDGAIIDESTEKEERYIYLPGLAKNLFKEANYIFEQIKILETYHYDYYRDYYQEMYPIYKSKALYFREIEYLKGFEQDTFLPFENFIEKIKGKAKYIEDNFEKLNVIRKDLKDDNGDYYTYVDKRLDGIVDSKILFRNFYKSLEEFLKPDNINNWEYKRELLVSAAMIKVELESLYMINGDKFIMLDDVIMAQGHINQEQIKEYESNKQKKI